MVVANLGDWSGGSSGRGSPCTTAARRWRRAEAVRRHLAEDLRSVVTMACITVWSVPRELRPLTWSRVDFKAGTVRLNPGKGTENKEGRALVMTPELGTRLEAQRAVTDEVNVARALSSRGCSTGTGSRSDPSTGPGGRPARRLVFLAGCSMIPTDGRQEPGAGWGLPDPWP